MKVKAVVAGFLGVIAVFAPRPGACDTYVRDDLNVIRTDTFAAIQRRNADLIARTGACIVVITVVAAGGNPTKFAYDTALAFGNHCALGAAILVEQNGAAAIRFEDASEGFRSDWPTISQNLGNGIASGDTNGAVMTAVNAIADGIIAHPAPSPPPVVYASPTPAPGVVDTVIGLLSANWQSTGGRIAIICACVLLLVLIGSAMGLGRAR
jgi:uncharacterized membrane protein YgcG